MTKTTTATKTKTNTTEENNLPQIFNFESHKIRVFLDATGEPWFVAREISEILGYRKASDAIRILDTNEKGAQVLHTLGGPQKLATINESGLYSLIFSSNKDEAKKFKKWVTSEVLPTIRKTGGYGQQVNLNDPKQLRDLLLGFSERVDSLENKVANDQPKVDFYDDFINADGLYNLQNAARALGLGPNLFINSLKNNYLFYQGGTLVPYQRYRTQGLFVVKSNVVDNQSYYQTYITPKGMTYFAKHGYCKSANSNIDECGYNYSNNNNDDIGYIKPLHRNHLN